MSVFPDWQNFMVHQRRDATGCIPTGYEFLLRAAGAQGIDFAAFQDDFDLDYRGGTPRNHFQSVAEEIKRKYTNVEFTCEFFPKGKGLEKLARVEDLIIKQKPVLVSLALSPAGGWHIMPVVASDNDSLVLLHHVDAAGAPYTIIIKKHEFTYRHDNWTGGEEISFLTKC